MKWLYVFIGGGLGSILRYYLSLKYEFNGSRFPWTTFFINISGALCMGILSGLIMRCKEEDPQLKYLFMVGICGGYTTFSGFSLEFFKLIENKKTILALCYAASSTLLGVLAVSAGLKIASKLL